MQIWCWLRQTHQEKNVLWWCMCEWWVSVRNTFHSTVSDRRIYCLISVLQFKRSEKGLVVKHAICYTEVSKNDETFCQMFGWVVYLHCHKCFQQCSKISHFLVEGSTVFSFACCYNHWGNTQVTGQIVRKEVGHMTRCNLITINYNYSLCEHFCLMSVR